MNQEPIVSLPISAFQYMNKGWKGRRQQNTRLNIREERARLSRKRNQERKKQIKVGGAELTLKAFE